MRYPVLLLLVLGALCLLAGCGGNSVGMSPTAHTATVSHATITDCGTRYDVVLDYTSGTTAYAMGQQYAAAIKQIMPTYEQIADALLAGTAENNATFYQALIARAKTILPQVDQAYRDEMRGMGSKYSGGTTDKMGDGKLSLDEVYALNLIPDVARDTECSAVSVFGTRSATGSTMTARLLDWTPNPNMPKMQAVISILHGTQSICLIGYLGFQSVLTAYNSHGLFGAILDSSTGAPYPASLTGMRSYPFDLRHALETQTTLDSAAAYMDTTTHKYAYNHLVWLSDATVSKVVENDLTDVSANARHVRTSSSTLNTGVTWGLSNALGSVNSFVLKGNHDNHTGDPYNYKRWNNIRTQLSAKGSSVTLAELEAVASYHAKSTFDPSDDGQVYSPFNQMIVVFQPASKTLLVAFRPRSNVLPTKPTFVTVTNRI